MTTTGLTLVWGNTPDDRQHEAHPTTTAELGTVLDSLHTAALARGLPQQVDVWTGPWKVGDPGLPDPLLQFLLGHPDRGAVLWHETTASWQACDLELPALSEPITYDNGGAADPMEPQATRITPAQTRDIVLFYQQTGQRASVTTWVPID